MTVPTADRRSRNRERLFAAAMELFAERGYEATTMDGIAARSGLSRRSVFNHFPSKGDLAVEWTARRRDAAAARAGLTDPGPDDDVPDRLRAWFRALGELSDADPAGTVEVVLGWLSVLGPVRHRTGTPELLRGWLEAGRANGTVAADVDPVLAAELLFEGYLGALYRWCAEPAATRGAVTPALAAVVEQLLRGLTPR